jgi:hypothetical protein
MNSESLDALSSFDNKSAEKSHVTAQETHLREQATRETHQDCLNECCQVTWKPTRSFERSRNTR